MPQICVVQKQVGPIDMDCTSIARDVSGAMPARCTTHSVVARWSPVATQIEMLSDRSCTPMHDPETWVDVLSTSEILPV